MSSYAVIATGGKQYKVKEGDELLIERVDYTESKPIKLDKVLLVADEGAARVGSPYLDGAYCEAEVIKEVKDRKVISFKYIRREKAATKIGHRQKHLKIRIKKIHAKI